MQACAESTQQNSIAHCHQVVDHIGGSQFAGNHLTNPRLMQACVHKRKDKAPIDSGMLEKPDLLDWCAHLPLQNTFVHFPQHIDEVNAPAIIKRCTTCPGLLQGRIGTHSHVDSSGKIGVIESTCKAKETEQRRLGFAANSLARRCSVAVAPCWAEFLPPVIQTQLWGGGPHLARSEQSVPTDSLCSETNAWLLSNDAAGCRQIQRGLDVAANDQEREQVARAFHGRVWEAMRSPHANHVLQKLIVTLPPQASQFVVDEIIGTRGGSIRASTHQYGCRIIQRLLEHCRQDQVEHLLEQIMSCVAEVAKSQYGVCVIRHMLENGVDHPHQLLMDQIIENSSNLVTDVFGRAVLSTAIAVASEGDLRALDRRLRKANLLAPMVQCRKGYHGAIALLESLAETERKDVWKQLVAQVPELPNNRYAQIVASKLSGGNAN